MFWKEKISTTINIIKALDPTSMFCCSEAFLISVERGKGSLKKEIVNSACEKNDYTYSSVLTLNGTPLIQREEPPCHTCTGLLATGYGIENASCDELKEISEKINSEFVDLKTSINTLYPLLGLLESGLYVIADSKAYPTDGDGRFFWSVPNPMTDNSATAVVLTEDCDCIYGVPAFLYPSQSTDCFNEDRANYYLEQYSDIDNCPRAVAYYLGEFISVLLDGHHKATAAALLGRQVNCIQIIPLTDITYKPVNSKKINQLYFGNIIICAKEIKNSILTEISKTFDSRQGHQNKDYICQETKLISRNWEDKYLKSAKKYPNVSELAESLIININDITNELIENCLKNLTEQNALKLKHIITSLSVNNDVRTKKLALQCVKTGYLSLRKTAFRALVKIKKDNEVEQFFIDYLIDDYDKHSLLRDIADSYWDD